LKYTSNAQIITGINTTGATSGAGTAYPFRASEVLVEFMLLDLLFSA